MTGPASHAPNWLRRSRFFDCSAVPGGNLEVQEVIFGVGGVVAQEFEKGAMKLIGAGLQRHLHVGAVVHAVFGGIGAGLDFHFFDRVDGRIEIYRVDQRLAGDHAVQSDALVGVALAVGADLCRAGEKG